MKSLGEKNSKGLWKILLISALLILLTAFLLNEYAKRKTRRYIGLRLPFTEFKRYKGSPIIFPDGDGPDAAATFNPAAIVKNGIVYLFYRAQPSWHGVSVIMLATSEDGVHFKRAETIVIAPEYVWEKGGGCEDPRIVEVNGTYYMTYTAYDGKTARLALALSRDLLHWKKIGLVFPRWGWCKSGAIVPVKINGYYWMYFGDSNIWIARSKDLIHWETRKERVVLRPREGYFDSRLVEPGPPPIVYDEGILLLYNAADENLTYYVGWALFSKDDPTKVLARAEEPILRPETPWERFGQVPNVVFAEGLVEINGKWYLYYGASDTVICVAISNKTLPVIYPHSPRGGGNG